MKPASHPLTLAANTLHTNLVGLGERLGVTKGAVSQWKRSGRSIPILHCLAIEEATEGVITRQMLRPHDWHLLWPELIKYQNEQKSQAQDSLNQTGKGILS